MLTWRDERDGYKARDKLRGKELDALARRVHHKEEHPWTFEDCMRSDCSGARAAISISPEEAREKERR